MALGMNFVSVVRTRDASGIESVTINGLTLPSAPAVSAIHVAFAGAQDLVAEGPVEMRVIDVENPEQSGWSATLSEPPLLQPDSSVTLVGVGEPVGAGAPAVWAQTLVVQGTVAPDPVKHV